MATDPVTITIVWSRDNKVSSIDVYKIVLGSTPAQYKRRYRIFSDGFVKKSRARKLYPLTAFGMAENKKRKKGKGVNIQYFDTDLSREDMIATHFVDLL